MPRLLIVPSVARSKTPAAAKAPFGPYQDSSLVDEDGGYVGWCAMPKPGAFDVTVPVLIKRDMSMSWEYP